MRSAEAFGALRARWNHACRSEVWFMTSSVITFRPFSRALRTNALDRKSTRLNSSHANISYAVFCLKKISETRLLRLTRYFTDLTFFPPHLIHTFTLRTATVRRFSHMHQADGLKLLLSY